MNIINIDEIHPEDDDRDHDSEVDLEQDDQQLKINVWDLSAAGFLESGKENGPYPTLADELKRAYEQDMAKLQFDHEDSEYSSRILEYLLSKDKATQTALLQLHLEAPKAGEAFLKGCMGLEKLFGIWKGELFPERAREQAESLAWLAGSVRDPDLQEAALELLQEALDQNALDDKSISKILYELVDGLPYFLNAECKKMALQCITGDRLRQWRRHAELHLANTQNSEGQRLESTAPYDSMAIPFDDADLPDLDKTLSANADALFFYTNLAQWENEKGVSENERDLRRRYGKAMRECFEDPSITELIAEGTDDQKLTSLPKAIGLLTGLKRLSLKNNDLQEMPESAAELNNLEYLDVSDNRRLERMPLLFNHERMDINNVLCAGASLADPGTWRVFGNTSQWGKLLDAYEDRYPTGQDILDAFRQIRNKQQRQYLLQNSRVLRKWLEIPRDPKKVGDPFKDLPYKLSRITQQSKETEEKKVLKTAQRAALIWYRDHVGNKSVSKKAKERLAEDERLRESRSQTWIDDSADFKVQVRKKDVVDRLRECEKARNPMFYLRNMKQSDMPPDYESYLSYARYLFVDGNNFDALFKDLIQLENVRHISASNCQITSLPLEFERMRGIQFDLSHNFFSPATEKILQAWREAGLNVSFSNRAEWLANYLTKTLAAYGKRTSITPLPASPTTDVTPLSPTTPVSAAIFTSSPIVAAPMSPGILISHPSAALIKRFLQSELDYMNNPHGDPPQANMKLGGQGLKDLPEGFFTAIASPYLTILDLSGNNLSGVIDLSPLRHAYKLKEIRLNDNELTGVIGLEALTELSALSHIDISRNQIAVLPEVHHLWRRVKVHLDENPWSQASLTELQLVKHQYPRRTKRPLAPSRAPTMMSLGSLITIESEIILDPNDPIQKFINDRIKLAKENRDEYLEMQNDPESQKLHLELLQMLRKQQANWMLGKVINDYSGSGLRTYQHYFLEGLTQLSNLVSAITDLEGMPHFTVQKDIKALTALDFATKLIAGAAGLVGDSLGIPPLVIETLKTVVQEAVTGYVGDAQEERARQILQKLANAMVSLDTRSEFFRESSRAAAVAHLHYLLDPANAEDKIAVQEKALRDAVTFITVLAKKDPLLEIERKLTKDLDDDERKSFDILQRLPDMAKATLTLQYCCAHDKFGQGAAIYRPYLDIYQLPADQMIYQLTTCSLQLSIHQSARLKAVEAENIQLKAALENTNKQLEITNNEVKFLRGQMQEVRQAIGLNIESEKQKTAQGPHSSASNDHWSSDETLTIPRIHDSPSNSLPTSPPPERNDNQSEVASTQAVKRPTVRANSVLNLKDASAWLTENRHKFTLSPTGFLPVNLTQDSYLQKLFDAPPPHGDAYIIVTENDSIYTKNPIDSYVLQWDQNNEHWRKIRPEPSDEPITLSKNFENKCIECVLINYGPQERLTQYLEISEAIRSYAIPVLEKTMEVDMDRLTLANALHKGFDPTRGVTPELLQHGLNEIGRTHPELGGKQISLEQSGQAWSIENVETAKQGKTIGTPNVKGIEDLCKGVKQLGYKSSFQKIIMTFPIEPYCALITRDDKQPDNKKFLVHDLETNELTPIADYAEKLIGRMNEKRQADPKFDKRLDTIRLTTTKGLELLRKNEKSDLDVGNNRNRK